VIVGFDSHFLGYRHAGYYLPQFLTVEYPALDYPDGKRVFTMVNRDTKLLGSLPLGSIKRFVLFPLPAGQEYTHYFDEIRRHFPSGALTSTVINHREYFSGSATDLPLLFPGLTAPSVYTRSHALQ